jgi:hypothetical protein
MLFFFFFSAQCSCLNAFAKVRNSGKLLDIGQFPLDFEEFWGKKSLKTLSKILAQYKDPAFSNVK